MLRLLAVALLLPTLASAQGTNDAVLCQQGNGTLLTGSVATEPVFKGAEHKTKGVYLSHTHFTLKGDNGTSYDVAVDNVFAGGYTKNLPKIPAPLTTIHAGDKVELCGRPYTGGDTGIHWVHNNCGETPVGDQADGWVKKIAPDGSLGENMEANRAFCSIFSH